MDWIPEAEDCGRQVLSIAGASVRRYWRVSRATGRWANRHAAVTGGNDAAWAGMLPQSLRPGIVVTCLYAVVETRAAGWQPHGWPSICRCSCPCRPRCARRTPGPPQRRRVNVATKPARCVRCIRGKARPGPRPLHGCAPARAPPIRCSRRWPRCSARPRCSRSRRLGSRLRPSWRGRRRQWPRRSTLQPFPTLPLRASSALARSREICPSPRLGRSPSAGVGRLAATRRQASFP
jgi:hypothetical protein